MRIYFARHGQSEANLLREFSNRGWKHGLTERGRGEAQRMSAKLSGEGISRVIASPLRRAFESAELAANILGVAVQQSDALREWDVGVLEGRSDDAAWDQYFQLRKDWAAGHRHARIEAGESLEDIEARFVPFIQELTLREPSEGRVLLVSHGGLYSAALPSVLSNLDRQFAEAHGLDTASYVVAERRQDRLLCIEWAGTPIVESE